MASPKEADYRVPVPRFCLLARPGRVGRCFTGRHCVWIRFPLLRRNPVAVFVSGFGVRFFRLCSGLSLKPTPPSYEPQSTSGLQGHQDAPSNPRNLAGIWHCLQFRVIYDNVLLHVGES